MSTGTIAFVSNFSLGASMEQCEEIAMSLFSALLELRTEPISFNALVQPIESPGHAYSEFIDLADLAVVGDLKYPFVHANITYDPTRLNVDSFQCIQLKFGLTKIHSSSGDATVFGYGS